MRIIATCMAANEADIVESFVRHNARFLDALVVLDHASVDATGAILAQLAREGLPLVLLRDDDRAFRQGERQTQLARRYLRELRADYAFALDADEFLKVPSRGALEESLGALGGACGLVPLQNYFGVGDASAADPLCRLTRRMARERSVSRKVVLPAAFAADETLQVSLGNHAAVRAREGRVEVPPHREVAGVHLAHFPVRSAEQVRKKVLLGWLSHRLTRPERFLGAQASAAGAPASHWRALFEMLVRGELADDGEALARARALYSGDDRPVETAELVEDPLDVAHELRFTAAAQPSALATLAAWADRLVTDVNAAAATRPR